MTKIQQFSNVTLSLLLAVVLLMVPQLAAAGEKTTAKTSPPPLEMQPMASYTGYTYLQSSSIAITTNSNQTIAVSVSTEAKSVVDEIGATIQWQEWTGSTWINLVPTGNVVKYNAISASGSHSRSSRVGYYYRAKVTHYVKEGTTTESVVEYSNTFLAS